MTTRAQSRAIPLLACVLLMAVCLGLSEPAARDGTAQSTAVDGLELVSHHLTLTIDPEHHRLRGEDLLTLMVTRPGVASITFTLNAALAVRRASHERAGQSLPLSVRVKPGRAPEHDVGADSSQDRVQEVTLSWPAPLAPGEPVQVRVEFDGVLNDPPRPSRQLRFVAPSQTAGHIGPEGVYLSGETAWYPDRPGALTTFDVRVTLPAGWLSVTHGREIRRETGADGAVTSDWHTTERAEALTLVANRFVPRSREWRDVDGRRVTLAAYLLPDQASLADEYLEASANYLAFYTRLLGPYPFAKFAVVENFFPSGLGMPSFTLLGSRVIARRYVQPYALGHEIVHSWLGNSVFNDPATGNWVEGLTTYLANYYYDEATGTPEQARQQRRLMLLGYAIYVNPEQDYPIARFTHKRDQRDNAVGYQKTAMVFHMLRRRLGEPVFWNAVRRLVAEFSGRRAGWVELEQVFAKEAGIDLRWFFAQWIEREGAPVLRVRGARSAPADSGGQATVTVELRQDPGGFRLQLPIRVGLAGDATEDYQIELWADEATVELAVGKDPRTFVIDPGYHVFRRIPRWGLPPMLNLFATDRRRTVVLPQGTGVEAEAYAAVADRLRDEESGQVGHESRTTVVRADEARTLPAEGSVLILGTPASNPAVAWARQPCGDAVTMQNDGFTVGGQTYRGPGLALVVSCSHPAGDGRVITVFYGTSPEAIGPVARLLFFYGWQSYLVFREGAVIARGDFVQDGEELEVRFDT